MTIEKTFQGAYNISDKGHKIQYMGYTLKDAKQLFKQYLKNETSNKSRNRS